MAYLAQAWSVRISVRDVNECATNPKSAAESTLHPCGTALSPKPVVDATGSVAIVEKFPPTCHVAIAGWPAGASPERPLTSSSVPLVHHSPYLRTTSTIPPGYRDFLGERVQSTEAGEVVHILDPVEYTFRIHLVIVVPLLPFFRSSSYPP